ncbi:C39 family peptidase [Acidocella sp. MX-AZ03]|nr:C39 family peptidase [Acidocella sp. MX-AZ03]WBO59440.1 C39 family peptidase [Acidocella sp. MX-AZ03]
MTQSVGLLATMLALAPTNALAGQIPLNGLATGTGSANITVQSFQARKFNTTIRQQYDFSCGSAALATLLLYTYHIKASETSVFTDMFLNGDRKAIRESGFSLLDMKEYLSRRNIPAGGFRAPLHKLAEIKIPAIVLINERGYKHFVVLRGIRNGQVMLADPAIGLRSVSVSSFRQQWSGIFFIILAHLELARAGFNDGQDWSGEPSAPLDLSHFIINLATLQQVGIPDLEKF